ncbi:hypothetical protein [Streptomyces sp. E5N91]|nr:hypothetical protein [Streptomyces sp. E5N91]
MHVDRDDAVDAQAQPFEDRNELRTVHATPDGDGDGPDQDRSTR